MTSDCDPTRSEILEFVYKSFSFLDSVKGVKRQVETSSGGAIVAYIAGPLVYELRLDWRERYATLLVCLAIAGRRPPGYYMHEGMPVRVHLSDALLAGDAAQRRVGMELRASVPKPGGVEMTKQIARFASALRDSFESFQSNVDQIFNRS